MKRSLIADLITLSRIPFSLFLLVVPPFSPPFAVLWLLCGITDVLDGFAARRLHTESEKGAMLDSAADLVFAAVYAARVLPLLALPLPIMIWAAVIAVIKLAGLLCASRRTHVIRIEHSPGNKLTGALLFLLPLSVRFIDIRYGATAVCVAATAAAAGEIIRIFGKTPDESGRP